jgi:hypothetical protein
MGGEKAKITFFNSSAFKDLKASVSSVSIQNHQLIITGSGLAKITTATLKNADQTATFQVEDASDTRLTTNALKNISLIAGSMFDLILSDAYGSATFQVSFTVPDGSVGASKLSSMGATAGQILKYNGTSWAPATQIDAQTFLGTWNASNNSGGVPDLNSTLLNPGDYYVVSVAGTFNGVAYAVGDWIISDGYGWQKIPYSKTAVTSFQGRKGIITLGPSDYVSLKDVVTQKITGSSINDLADIDFAIAPLNGQVLKYNSMTLKWAPANDNSAASGIALTDISASAPLSYNNTTGIFSLPASNILALPLTSLSAGTGAITTSDSILEAFGKLMSLPSDYVSRSSGASIVTGTIAVSGTGMITVPTASGTTLTEVANVTYVNNVISANGVWSKSGSDINYTAGKVGIGTASPGALLNVNGNTIIGGNTYPFAGTAFRLNVVSSDAGLTVVTDLPSDANTGRAFTVGATGEAFSRANFYSNGFLGLGSGSATRDVFFGRSAVNTLRIGSAYDGSGSGNLVVNGNVGIGTTSPQYRLDMATPNLDTQADSLRLNPKNGPAGGGGTAYGGGLIFSPQYTGYSKRTAGILQTAEDNFFRGGLAFFTNGTGDYITDWSERMRIDKNGNVGIGTSSPVLKLNVVSTGDGSIGSQSTANTSYAGMNIYDYTGAGAASFQYGNPSAGAFTNEFVVASRQSSIPIKFYQGGIAAGNERVRIDSSSHILLLNANVGIGTTTPTAPLQVVGDISNNGNLNVTNNGLINMSQNAYGDKWYFAGSGIKMSMDSASTSWLTTIGGSTTLTKYRWSTTKAGSINGPILDLGLDGNATFYGNVGIGITPSAPLHVKGGSGDINTFGIMRFDTNAGTNDVGVKIGAVAGAGTAGYAFFQGMHTGVANDAHLILNPNAGNVGIGTTNPSTLLHVNTATAGATVATFQSGTGSCTVVPNTGVSCSSDKRLKENIEEIMNGLDRVLNLRGVTFKWIDRQAGDETRHMGFIAQEVEKIAPELVKVDARGYKQVNYANFVAVLTSAIKEFFHRWSDDSRELHREIASVKTENENLKKRSTKLEAENIAIKKALCEMNRKEFCARN